MRTVGAGSRVKLAAALAAGAAVSVTLGIYGRTHDATGRSLVTAFFSATITLKVWLGTAAVTLALFQGATGLRMYGKLGPGRGPPWITSAHRLSGTAAFLLTIPVAYHCLWALGFQWNSGTRVLAHGILGCFFFGALAAKVLVAESRGMPRWALPLLGGLLFTALVLVWGTSALWFFQTQGIKL